MYSSEEFIFASTCAPTCVQIDALGLIGGSTIHVDVKVESERYAKCADATTVDASVDAPKHAPGFNRAQTR
jgi:hypothetical protein